MLRWIRPALATFFLLTVVTGAAYPSLITLIASLAFPDLATGSLIVRHGRAVGSSLIGQSFTSAGYFWSRPSGTEPQPYNGGASSGTNIGPTNPALIDRIEQRVASLHDADPSHVAPVPIDLVTSSGSGLDPHISPAAAEYQVRRVARVRHLDENRVRELVARHTEGRTLGLLGEPRVNVLELNLALDALR